MQERTRLAGLKWHPFHLGRVSYENYPVLRESVSGGGLHRREGESFLVLEGRAKGEEVFAQSFLTPQGDLMFNLKTRSSRGEYHPELRASEFVAESVRYFGERVHRIVVLINGESMLLQHLNWQIRNGTTINSALEKLWGVQALASFGLNSIQVAHVTRADTMGLNPTVLDAVIVIEPGPARPRPAGVWQKILFWRR